MLNKNSLKELLSLLGFSNNGKMWNKEVNGNKFFVDFEKGILGYPEGVTINDKTTSNFDKDENFVVFECVHRLVEKGYRPEHIELEKKWTLGHDAKGGKADICVSDQNGNMLIIIECKTYGKYNKALKEVITDGGQLFSYWQQERGTKWLSLYTSDIKNGGIEYIDNIINCLDDANVELISKKDETVHIYKNAHTKEELFDVWDETYQKQFLKGIIFSKNTQAYQIGIKPLCKCDLKDFNPDDKIVNQFEEILRHNNVSDKENAFNRLIALFICKLYDETKKGDDDEMDFQYKIGSDTYETLQDRLQRLHRDGMENFMGEKISYIESDYAEKLFANKVDGPKRKAAIESLKETIRILKFYSNNDFSFKDVHNEELFLQNGKVLVEMVQLFERYRIVYPNKHQFLGDLFEQLLNKGFKQNEGQFFTPMPITRFIRDSIPINKISNKNNDGFIPKIIDYACGAGHFLTEAVEAINNYFEKNGHSDLIENNNRVLKSIYGIEKDYRLARVARVSLYMNGAGQGKIIFGDGLEQYKEKGVENNTFDILVANPPYSVSGFKEHLKLKNNELSILQYISRDSSSIETLFVERIAQLLKPNGIAAVLLPAAILSNGNDCYTKARKLLLQNFNIRAIVQLGDKTFGETTTHTVIIFLEKFNEPPKRSEIVNDSVDSILLSENIEGWEDAEILKDYLKIINVSFEEYKAFIDEKYEIDNRKDNEYFSGYLTSFKDKKEKLISKNTDKGKIKNEFYKIFKEIERDKLYYFSLVYQQDTLIITAPTDTDNQKIFLGYSWSNKKGKEGIQIETPGGDGLFDNENRYAEGTLADLIRSSFFDKKKDVEKLKKYYNYLPLKKMIDFSRDYFNVAIKTQVAEEITIESNYPLVRLSKLESDGKIKFTRGSGLNKDSIKKDGENKCILYGELYTLYSTVINEVKSKTNLSGKKLSKLGDVLVPGTTTADAMGIAIGRSIKEEGIIIGGDINIIRTGNNVILGDYLAYLLSNGKIKLQLSTFAKGSNILHLANDDIKTIKIPLAPIDVQKNVVKDCLLLDEKFKTQRMSIADYAVKIDSIFKKYGIITN